MGTIKDQIEELEKDIEEQYILAYDSGERREYLEQLFLMEEQLYKLKQKQEKDNEN